MVSRRTGPPPRRSSPPRPSRPPVGVLAAPVKVAPPPTNAAPVELPAQLSVGDLAGIIAHSPVEVIKALMRVGIMANINQQLDFETAARIATSFGVPVRKPKAKAESSASQRAGLEAEIADSKGMLRAPVVTIMGHVDHGKTTLLDVIRGTSVAAGEAGGITQSIGAYQIEWEGKQITFIDTPGHAAFTAMRASGAQVTDIAILVVAANDGVQPQTIEAIDHARAAKVPIIVAINKVDAPGADLDRVKAQLAEHNVIVESYGGEVVSVEVSALKKTGINELLEAILLVAEVSELKSNLERPGVGVVIESHVDRARGPIATVLVRAGTLKLGDNVVAGTQRGRIRSMIDGFGREIPSAPPSTPVQVLGLAGLPKVGDQFDVQEDEKSARGLVETRVRLAAQRGEVRSAPTLADVRRRVRSGETRQLNLVLKAGTQGAIDAVRRAVEVLSTEEVQVNIVHLAAGAVAESDVLLAAASQAIVLAFDTDIEPGASRQGAQQGVEIRHYKIIYELIDHINAVVKGLVQPELKEVTTGHALIQKVFPHGKRGKIAGVRVTDGIVKRNSQVRVNRKGQVMFTGRIGSMRHLTENVRELTNNLEGGIVVEGFTDYQEGDILEVFEVQEA